MDVVVWIFAVYGLYSFTIGIALGFKKNREIRKEKESE